MKGSLLSNIIGKQGKTNIYLTTLGPIRQKMVCTSQSVKRHVSQMNFFLPKVSFLRRRQRNGDIFEQISVD